MHSLALGTQETVDESPKAKGDLMRAMLQKYSADLKPVTTTNNDVPEANSDVILVTGTTGSLGCFILASLIEDKKVSRIYALNRAAEGAGSLRERQRKSLESRGLGPSILESDKVILLEGDTSAGNLGLEEDTYLQVCHHSFPP